jgi:two-component system, NtrC family, C4-dicarboxylate transport sensor histidine kinase DctB
MAEAQERQVAGRQRAGLVAAALAGLAVVLLAGFLAHGQALRVFLDDTARRGDATLRLAVSTLSAQLERFERLPRLVGDQPIIRALANAPDDPARVAAANLYLRHIAVTLGASDVYFMDADGLTRAASNFDQAASFVGGNFAFRPYFSDALAGDSGRFFAVGTTSGKRGYYFGAPVRANGRTAGVVAVKIDLDAIEDTWRGGDAEIVVTDPGSIVFLSSRPDWLYRALLAPAEEDLARTAATRRYADVPISGPPLFSAPVDAEGLVRLAGGSGMLVRSEKMPEADWKVSVLLDTALAERQAMTGAAAVMLALGLGGMVAAALWQRRARLGERLALQAAARAELERRVRERTAELAEMNLRLAGEVAERTAADEGLRQAQAGLIQAAKLAALGQMSAALSHEFNQPLAAVRTYAENLPVLIDRGRTAEARGNAGRILALVDRMSALGRDLRNFARTPDQTVARTTLADAIRTAAEIAGPRLRAAGVELTLDIAPDLPDVAAEPLRLEQVLVNVMANAADAADGGADRRVILTAERHGEGARIRVRDFGPGVPGKLRDRIFDPFFSTKGVGKGLGLGLSISYNIVKDFGGDLSVVDPVGGGAEFRIDLRAAPAESRAA